MRCLWAAAAYVAVSLMLPRSGMAAEMRVLRAYLDAEHHVHIVRADGSSYTPPMEVSPDQEQGQPPAQQEDAGEPQIASDGRTVAWTVFFPACCASYPSPLELVVYRDGVIIHRIRPARHYLYEWTFASKPWLAVFYGTFQHGNPDSVCELVDVRRGKQMALWEAASGNRLPAWARVLKSCADAEGEPPYNEEQSPR